MLHLFICIIILIYVLYVIYILFVEIYILIKCIISACIVLSTVWIDKYVALYNVFVTYNKSHHCQITICSPLILLIHIASAYQSRVYICVSSDVGWFDSPNGESRSGEAECGQAGDSERINYLGYSNSDQAPIYSLLLTESNRAK